MNCDDSKSLLVDHYFNEVDPETRKALEAHLRQCPGCWQEYLAIKRSVEYLAADPIPPPATSEGLKKSIERELRKEYGRSLWDLVSYRIPAYVVLAALVGAVLLTLALGRTGEIPPQRLERSTLTRPGTAEYYDSIRVSSRNVF